MWNKKEIQYVIKKLERIKETRGGCVYYKGQGVYGYVGVKTNPKFLRSWDKFSGSVQYPVNDKESPLTPRDQFHILTNLWEGSQLKLRLDLVDHLLPLYKELLDILR